MTHQVHLVDLNGNDILNSLGDVKVAGDFVEMAALSATGNGGALLATMDVSQYKLFSIYFKPAGGLNLTVGFFHSNSPAVCDIPLQMQRSDGVRFSTIANPADVLLECPIFFRYLAILLTFWAAGTVDAIAEFFTQTVSPLVVNTVINDSNSNPILGNQGSQNAISANNVSTMQNSVDFVNSSARGVLVYVNVSVIGAGSLVLHIQGKDLQSGSYTDLFVASAALVGTGEVAYELYPGASGSVAGQLVQSQSGILPHDWRLQVVGANGSTFFVNYALEM